MWMRKTRRIRVLDEALTEEQRITAQMAEEALEAGEREALLRLRVQYLAFQLGRALDQLELRLDMPAAKSC